MEQQRRWLAVFRRYVLLSAGALLLAINFNIFITPSQIAPGGAAGVTLIVNALTGWSESAILFGLQILMIGIGFWHLGRWRFVMNTLYVSLLYSVSIGLLKPLLPAGITDDLLLNTIYGALVGGIGMGLIYAGQGNTAGTSVISRLVQTKTGIPISQVYIMVDGGILVAQAASFGWDKALYGMMMLFIWGMAADYVQEGPSVVRTVFIVTNNPKRVATALFDQLQVGVTAWTGTGMFTDIPHEVLFCTVNRADVGTLKSIIYASDPNAFTVIGHGHRAIGGVIHSR